MEIEKKQRIVRVFVRVCLIVQVVGVMAFFTFRVNAQNVASVLDKASAAYESSNGIKATFTLHTRSEIQKISESLEGTVQMKGDKFTLITPDMTTWFDGTTQWSYVDRNDEVNISTPTGEELQMTNPALLIRNSQKGYTSVLKGESTAANGKAAYDLELIPKKKGDIVKVELQIEKFSSLPAAITVYTKNGVTSTIRISQLETGINQSDNFFVFKESDYSDVEIVDLR